MAHLRWSQVRLAAEVSKAGVPCTKQRVNTYLRGRRSGDVAMKTASAFGAALGCNPAYLLGLTDDPVPVRAKRR